MKIPRVPIMLLAGLMFIGVVKAMIFGGGEANSDLPESLKDKLDTVIVLTIDKPAMDIDVIDRLRY